MYSDSTVEGEYLYYDTLYARILRDGGRNVRNDG